MNTDVMFSKNSDEWQTPPNLYERLNETFHFELDPCTTTDNPLKTKFHHTKEYDGLRWPWHNYSTFVNPPYSQIKKWVDKALIELQARIDLQLDKGDDFTTVKPIVMLVPARTDVQWFHRITVGNWAHVVFLLGRLRFSNSKDSAPFPSCLIVLSNPYHFFAEFDKLAAQQMSCYKLNLKLRS